MQAPLRCCGSAVGSRAYRIGCVLANSDNAGASGLSVLVVESDEESKVVLLDHLRRRGFSIMESRHGGASIRAASERSFDYVVADIDWSGVSDGAVLARWIRATRPEIRLILTSKSLTHWVPADSAIAGLPIIRKPFHQEELDRFLPPVAVMAIPGW